MSLGQMTLFCSIKSQTGGGLRYQVLGGQGNWFDKPQLLAKESDLAENQMPFTVSLDD